LKKTNEREFRKHKFKKINEREFRKHKFKKKKDYHNYNLIKLVINQAFFFIKLYLFNRSLKMQINIFFLRINNPNDSND